MRNLLLLGIIVLLVSCKNKQDVSESKQSIPIGEQIANAFENNDWDRVILLTDSVYKSGENISGLTLAYAQALRETGRIEESIEVLNKEIENKESSIQKHYLYNELGRAYNMIEDYDNGIKAYNHALEIAPSYARSLVGLADLYEHKGNISEAIYYYDHAALFFYENGFSEELLAIGLKMTEIAPENEKSWDVLSKAYKTNGDYEGEEKCLQRQMAILLKEKEYITNENDKETFVLSMIELSIAQFNLNKFDECMSSIQWLRNNTNSLGGYEEEIQSIEKECKKHL